MYAVVDARIRHFLHERLARGPTALHPGRCGLVARHVGMVPPPTSVCNTVATVAETRQWA